VSCGAVLVLVGMVVVVLLPLVVGTTVGSFVVEDLLVLMLEVLVVAHSESPQWPRKVHPTL